MQRREAERVGMQPLDIKADLHVVSQAPVFRKPGVHDDRQWRRRVDRRRHALRPLQQDRLLQQFEGFQLIQSTRARLAGQRLDQRFGDRGNTVQRVQTGCRGEVG